MVVISTKGDRLELAAPFHPDLAASAKALRGRWLGKEAGWVFALEHGAALRALCLRMWGVDGTSEAAADVVQLRIEVDEQDVRYPIWSAINTPVYLVGREIAASLQSRRSARPGRGVRFLTGGPRCRPETTHYWTVIPNGSVFLLKDTPRMAVEHIERAVAGHGRIELAA